MIEVSGKFFSVKDGTIQALLFAHSFEKHGASRCGSHQATELDRSAAEHVKLRSAALHDSSVISDTVLLLLLLLLLSSY